MKKIHSRCGRLLAVTLVSLLLALCILAVSCGGRGTDGEGGKGTNGAEVNVSDQGDVDALLEDLDDIVNSVDPSDFSQNQLSDAELGL